MSVLQNFLRILFPQKCPLCGEIIEFHRKSCPKCTDNPLRISGDFCHSCGYDKERCICKDGNISFSHITALYLYSGGVRHQIHQFKFYGDRQISKQFGDEMAFRAAECFYKADFDCVTFVPMSKRAEKQRGFNQSELLAKRVAQKLFIPCENLLIKTHETEKQHELGAAERKSNLKGAFALSVNADVKGKTVLLCDDIKTSGSTLKECEKVLFGNGAKDVYCICIALSDYGELFPIDKQL